MASLILKISNGGHDTNISEWHCHLVLHDEVCLGGTEVEGGLLEVLALMGVGKQEGRGNTVGSQVVDQELLALVLEVGAVVFVGKEESRGDRVRAQSCCQSLLALLLQINHLRLFER